MAIFNSYVKLPEGNDLGRLGVWVSLFWRPPFSCWQFAGMRCQPCKEGSVSRNGGGTQDTSMMFRELWINWLNKWMVGWCYFQVQDQFLIMEAAGWVLVRCLPEILPLNHESREISRSLLLPKWNRVTSRRRRAPLDHEIMMGVSLKNEGGFLSWGIPNSWRVYFMENRKFQWKSQSKMDDWW